MTNDWDEWRARALARKHDPSTSHAAASHMVNSGQLGRDQQTVLAYVRSHPGAIAVEVDEGTGRTGLWKRLPELEKMGMIYTSGARRNPNSRRPQRCWFAR